MNVRSSFLFARCASFTFGEAVCDRVREAVEARAHVGAAVVGARAGLGIAGADFARRAGSNAVGLRESGTIVRSTVLPRLWPEREAM